MVFEQTMVRRMFNLDNIMRLFLLTLLTMTAFAANSVFGRLALENSDGQIAIDPASYSMIRLVAGALMLVWLVRYNNKGNHQALTEKGNWLSAFALFSYAGAFSYAYLSLETGMGALILFSCVQGTMIGWSLYKGDRPSPFELMGMLIAFGAFIWMVSPGLTAPDPVAAGLMAISGIAWGSYSLRGKNAVDPLLATTGNFIRSVPFAGVLAVFAMAHLEFSPFGISMAIASGAISSAMGYALWYHVLKSLKSTQAAIVQLSVPVIAGFGGLIFLGEPMTQRFVIASVLILGGIAIAIYAKSKRA